MDKLFEIEPVKQTSLYNPFSLLIFPSIFSNISLGAFVNVILAG
jgi:hypothetical protein